MYGQTQLVQTYSGVVACTSRGRHVGMGPPASDTNSVHSEAQDTVDSSVTGGLGEWNCMAVQLHIFACMQLKVQLFWVQIHPAI